MTGHDELALLLDHSVLKPEATAGDIAAGAVTVREGRIGFYCVQPWWVKRAVAELAGSPARVVTVVGFPHGCERSEVKALATALAVADGAAEIDMVLNLGALKSGESVPVGADIAAVVKAAGAAPVKVILETAALTDAEKRLACRLAVEAGAAFVKTSTGFHPAGGASVDDVRLLRALVGPRLGVKASGGIRNLADTRAMLAAGANRIGTSASAAILAALTASP
ncbi:MAG: deoxyribose-phosphate aldolase [Betaproteobacteria bacterium]|nr:deoxyribose-phosphate aldolase [Betaproteobacteria bacterium]